jgi:hypothetical protein
MVRPSVNLETKEGEPALEARPFSMTERLREISMFFDGTDKIHQAMRKLVELFEQHRVEYAIVGGMAVNAHRHSRTTGDVDFLVRAEGLLTIRQLVSQGLLSSVAGRSRRFIEPTTGVQVDILVMGLFPGSGKPGPIAFPDPATVSELLNKVRYIDLKTLIELKLAAHRYQDFADVVNLIGANRLDESFMSRLHPSVHRDFIECLEEKRREDEYERRQDGAAE